MLEKIFGNDPRVKVINYLLIMKGEKLNKKQIALGSEVARSTLNTFFDDLIELNIISEEGKLYKLNEKSELVHILEQTQINLAEKVFNEESKKYIKQPELSDKELNQIFDEEYEFNIDEELEKLEEVKTVNSVINPSNYDAILTINNTRERISYEYTGK